VLHTGSLRNSDEILDAADVTDANAFEELQVYVNELPRATIPDQGRVDGLNTATILDQEGIDEEGSPRTNQIEADDPDTTSTVVVDRFPFGSSGTPIPGMPRGTLAHESWRDTPMESMWAPFRSRKDWELAYWVKMRSSCSSAAVNDLLAISDVCPFFLSEHCF
jgi:hypothetical protein